MKDLMTCSNGTVLKIISLEIVRMVESRENSMNTPLFSSKPVLDSRALYISYEGLGLAKMNWLPCRLGKSSSIYYNCGNNMLRTALVDTCFLFCWISRWENGPIPLSLSSYRWVHSLSLRIWILQGSHGIRRFLFLVLILSIFKINNYILGTGYMGTQKMYPKLNILILLLKIKFKIIIYYN